MIQFWENLVTDGQTDASDLIGRCPSNVKRPIVKQFIQIWSDLLFILSRSILYSNSQQL